MNKTEKIKKNILKKFMYNTKLKYNEIWEKSWCSSSNFDYHLKQLINENILIKIDEFYELTNKGTIIITEIDGETIVNNKKPVFCTFALVKNENGEILMNIRDKQPFLKFLNIPGGKVELGNFAKEEALRELNEETGIKADLDLRIISEKLTIDEDSNEIKHHIISYFYIGKNPSGKLIKRTREGKNFWMNPSKIKDFERFPDLDYTIPEIIKNESKIRICKVKRYMKKDKFTKIDFKWEN